MVRATYARVLARLNNALPTGWVEAQVTALCTQADYIIDGFTYPETISTSSNTAIEVAVDVVLRLMRQSDANRRASGLTSKDGVIYPENVIILTDEIKARIKSLINNSYYGIATVNTVG